MKTIAIAAISALSLSVLVTPPGTAETCSGCRDRVAEACALFAPRGSANRAACVEALLPFDCQWFFAAPMDMNRLWTLLNETR